MSESTMNRNLLSAVRFSFHIKKTPHINYFIRTVTIPGLTLPKVQRPSPLKAIPYPGDHIEYDELNLSFNVNENLSNYIELHTWITQLGFPDSYEQYREIESEPKYNGQGIYSDAYIMITSSANNPIVKINFTDVFPISLSSIEMDTSETAATPLIASVSFAYTSYKFETV